MDLDHTARAAARDGATVTNTGRTLRQSLHGVAMAGPVNHVDHRGRVYEVYAGGNDDFWVDPVVYCYTFSVRVNQTKGWGLHEHKDDRYTLVVGEVLTVLYDARTDSPTHGQSQQVTLSGEGIRQLRIPAGVWHLNINLAPQESFLINFPTQPYIHEAPDRLLLPWDTSEIPVDVRALLPRQFGLPTS